MIDISTMHLCRPSEFNRTSARIELAGHRSFIASNPITPLHKQFKEAASLSRLLIESKIESEEEDHLWFLEMVGSYD